MQLDGYVFHCRLPDFFGLNAGLQKGPSVARHVRRSFSLSVEICHVKAFTSHGRNTVHENARLREKSRSASIFAAVPVHKAQQYNSQLLRDQINPFIITQQPGTESCLSIIGDRRWWYTNLLAKVIQPKQLQLADTAVGI
jgi:hypothetical protein